MTARDRRDRDLVIAAAAAAGLPLRAIARGLGLSHSRVRSIVEDLRPSRKSFQRGISPDSVRRAYAAMPRG